MAAMPVQCPHCGRSYSVDGSLIGRKANCKGCGQTFALTASSERPASAVAATDESSEASGPVIRSPDAALPQTIGRFLVKERLGSGAFGRVYRATDPVLGREVALKVPRPGLLQNPRALERFLREARAAASLRHPSIVTVFETGIDRGEHYIATEFIDGSTLAAAIGQEGLDPRHAAEVTAALAEALHFAHAQGIVHRDVKPANVMLDRAGRPHLMDFGLARIEGATGEKLTQAGTVVGTPAYMAPEQAAGGGADANAASDQYSLGATLYELLTGRTPFSGPPEAVIYYLTHHDAEAPRTLRPKIPRELETVCQKAMARSPEQRYGSCQELADDLGRWLRGEPIRARRPARHNKVAAGLAASVIVGLIFLGGWAAMRWRKPVELDRVAAMNSPLADSAASVPASEDTSPNGDPAPLPSVTDKEGASSPKVQAPSSVATKVVEKPSERTPTAASKAIPKSEPTLSYEQRIMEAYRACEAGEPEKAEVLLADCPVESRGWEWYHCKRLCRFHLTTFQGHAGPVQCVAFSPDGNRLASGSEDGTIRVWEVGGPARDPLIGHGETVIRVAFTEDGSRVISVSKDKVIAFDVGTGKAQAAPMPLAGLTAADISADARWIVGGTGEGAVKVWDAATGRAVRAAKSDRARSIQDLAFSRDGQAIAYRTTDGWALLQQGEVKKAAGKRNREANPRKGNSIRCLALSPDGRALAAAARNLVTIYDLSTRRSIGEFPGRSGEVTSLAFSHDGKRIAAGAGDTLHIWETGAGDWITSLQAHAGLLRDIRFSPDNRRIAAASQDRNVYVWGISDGLSEKAVNLQTFIKTSVELGKTPIVTRRVRGSVSSIAFSKDCDRILLRQDFGDASYATFLNSKEFSYHAMFYGKPLYADFDYLAWCEREMISVRRFSDDVPPYQTNLGGLLIGVATSNILLNEKQAIPIWPDEVIPLDSNNYYISISHGSMDPKEHVKRYGVWDQRAGGWVWWRPLPNLRISICMLNTQFISKTRRLVTIPGDSGSPRQVDGIWVISAVTGETELTFSGDLYRIHPDGDRIAVRRNGRISLCSLQDGHEIRSFPGADCSFSPSGKLIATWQKQTATLWDLQTGQQRIPAFSPSSSIAFSPDERRVLAAEPGLIVVKDATTGKNLLKLLGPTGYFTFSPDGNSIVAADSDRAKIWVADRPERGRRPE